MPNIALEASAVLAEVNFLPTVLIMYHICQWTSDLSLDYLNIVQPWILLSGGVSMMKL